MLMSILTLRRMSIYMGMVMTNGTIFGYLIILRTRICLGT